MPKLLGFMWRRKILTVFTLIVLAIWWRSRYGSIWYTTRQATTAFAVVFDNNGILIQHIRLEDELFNAPGTEVDAIYGPPINDIAVHRDESYVISRLGLVNVQCQAPWRRVPTSESNFELKMLYGEGRNFYLPHWLAFLVFLLLWLRPYRKGIVASVRQKSPPKIDQGPQPTA